MASVHLRVGEALGVRTSFNFFSGGVHFVPVRLFVDRKVIVCMNIHEVAAQSVTALCDGSNLSVPSFGRSCRPNTGFPRYWILNRPLFFVGTCCRASPQQRSKHGSAILRGDLRCWLYLICPCGKRCGVYRD